MSRNKIGVLDDFLPGKMKGVLVQGQAYVISNIDGKLYAIDGACPHEKGKMAEGRLAGIVVTCPRHGAEYDVRTGKNLKKPRTLFAKASDIRSHKVTVEGNEVYLEL